MIEAAYGGRVLYYSGCMSQLTPEIGKNVEEVLKKAGVEYRWMDREGGLCCGRPMYIARRFEEARKLVSKNEEIIKSSGASVLMVSCPICYKMFRENYSLQGVQVLHYSTYFYWLVRQGYLKLEKSDICYVFHDPCELGRGSGIYEEPRKLIGLSANISEADKNRKESVCCGGSVGSITLSFKQRQKMTLAALDNLYTSDADAIATACPLCKATFNRYSERPVKDLAEIINAQSIGL